MQRLLATGLLILLLLAGCRGQQSPAPPIHPNLNMDFQERFDPQGYNPLFDTKSVSRKPIPGTVARNGLRDSSELFRGRTENGEYVEEIPVPVTRAVLERGQDRYNIYCTPCHGRTGDGNGVIMRGDYGYTPAPSYHTDRLRQVTNGYLYDVIANGVRSMPPYGHQIPVRDRWAIVAYIRALQRSQNARLENLPEDVQARLEENVDAAGTGQGQTTD